MLVKWMVSITVLLMASVAQAGPVIQAWKTDEGAQVVFVQSKELPMVDLKVLFAAGSSRDGALPGLSGMVSGLLETGAGDLNANQIALAFEEVGAQMSSSSSMDYSAVVLRSLSEHTKLDQAVRHLVLLLTKPTFPAEDLERERSRALIGLQYAAQSPDAIGTKAFLKAIYGTHPYGSPPDGTEASLKAMQRDDLIAFHRQYFVASNATIAMVGDVTLEQAKALAQKITAAMPRGQQAKSLAAVMPLAKAEQITLNHPSSQSHLMMGHPGVTRKDPDYMPIYLGNFILGGSGLTSRLSDEIREKRGLSYSVSSFFMPLEQSGPFEVSLQTSNEQMKLALQVATETLAKFRDVGPTEAEIVSAKKNITGGFPLRIDSNKDILEYLSVIGFYHLPLDYLDTFSARIEQVTSAQIKDAFVRRLYPDKMVRVIVGDTAKQ